MTARSVRHPRFAGRVGRPLWRPSAFLGVDHPAALADVSESQQEVITGATA
jgi:hypothetical protein